MREIDILKVKQTVYCMFLEMNRRLPRDVFNVIKSAHKRETHKVARTILKQILDNAEIAEKEGLALCQDTGTAVIYIEKGEKVLVNGNLIEAIEDGVEKAYIDGFYRKSMVKHPLDRVNTNNNLPASVHIEMVGGDDFVIMGMAKGGGSENASRVYMLNPTTTEDEVADTIAEDLIEIGGRACPPLFVGICIGGDLTLAPSRAKQLLFREVGEKSGDLISDRIASKVKERLNRSGVGPMGLGGDTTCLEVWADALPCHIASLPVAVSVCCHSLRRAVVRI